MTTTATDVIAREQVDRDLEALSRMGPRFMGSPASRDAVRYLVERFSQHPSLAVSTQEFGYLGWTPGAPPQLRVVAPEPLALDCIAYIYCGPTPPEGIRGELRALGEHWVIGDYKWDKLAIVDDGEIVGYVSARRDGVAIQQPLAETSRVVPHFGIGTADAQRLRAWLDAGETVTVEGRIECAVDPAARADNVVARLSGTGGGGRFVVCSHLDSMHVCPGANDNASGMAATLALADELAARPPAHDVDFVIFNGEEWDLAGSKAYVARAERAGELADVELCLNLDGIAYADERLQIWAGPEGLEDEMRAILASRDWPTAPAVAFVSPPPMGADHVPFFNFGIPSCMFTGYEMVRYHTSADVYEPRLAANVHGVAERALEVVRRLDAGHLSYATRGQLDPRPGWPTLLERLRAAGR